jgi:RNA polymerase sigma-70 factor (ECF subfamily)
MCRSDADDVRQCLNGNPEAYRRLVVGYEQPLLRYLTGRLGDRQRASEAAQEVFVRAYFALPKLTRPEAFFGWLLGIAERVAKEAQRARRRRREASLDDAVEAKPETAAAAGGVPDETVSRAVARLPEPYRQVVLLRFYVGRSCVQISDELRVPLGTVTKRLSRAYALLRQWLGEARGSADEQVSR